MKMNSSNNNIFTKFLIESKDGLNRIIGAALVVLIFIFLDFECFFQKYFNIPCLGCGMTRAWKSVLKGDFIQAFEYHRAYWTVPIIFIYIFKGNFLFKKHLWDIIIIIFIVVMFLENYISLYLLF